MIHYNYLDIDDQKYFDYINNKFDWQYISANLNSTKFLIIKLEKDCPSIADLYLNLIFCQKQLIQISFYIQDLMKTISQKTYIMHCSIDSQPQFKIIWAMFTLFVNQ